MSKGRYEDMGIKKTRQENVLDVHVGQEKLKRCQKDAEMSKEVKEGPRIKGNTRQRLRKKIKEEKHTKRKDTTCSGKFKGNP